MIRRPSRSTLFPYTTPFRSVEPLPQVVRRQAEQAQFAEDLLLGNAGALALPVLIGRHAPQTRFLEQVCGACRPINTGSARDRKSTRLNSSHANISYAVFCLK